MALNVPGGYCGDHPPVNRDALPHSYQQQIRDGEALTDDEFHQDSMDELNFTAHELHSCAAKAQVSWESRLAAVNPPLADLPPQQRAKKWALLRKAASSDAKRVGVYGLYGFSQLLYFR